MFRALLFELIDQKRQMEDGLWNDLEEQYLACACKGYQIDFQLTTSTGLVLISSEQRMTPKAGSAWSCNAGLSLSLHCKTWQKPPYSKLYHFA